MILSRKYCKKQWSTAYNKSNICQIYKIVYHFIRWPHTKHVDLLITTCSCKTSYYNFEWPIGSNYRVSMLLFVLPIFKLFIPFMQNLKKENLKNNKKNNENWWRVGCTQSIASSKGKNNNHKYGANLQQNSQQVLHMFLPLYS